MRQLAAFKSAISCPPLIGRHSILARSDNGVLRFFAHKTEYDSRDDVPFDQRTAEAKLSLGLWEKREGGGVRWLWWNKCARTGCKPAPFAAFEPDA